MTNVSKFNNQSIPEEIANSITHGLGALLSILGLVFLILKAHDVLGLVSGSVYGGSLILLYLMSTLYHSITNLKAKKILQIFDHCSIFFLIMGTYAPFCLVSLRGPLGYFLFGFNMVFAILGVVLNSVSLVKWHRLSLLLYLFMGWFIVFAIKPLIELVPLTGLILLAGGGILYTLGVLFYKAQRPRFMHMIWHFFVLFGSVCHYFCILLYVI